MVKLYKNALLARTNLLLKKKEKERLAAYKAAIEHSSSKEDSNLSKIVEAKSEESSLNNDLNNVLVVHAESDAVIKLHTISIFKLN